MTEIAARTFYHGTKAELKPGDMPLNQCAREIHLASVGSPSFDSILCLASVSFNHREPTLMQLIWTPSTRAKLSQRYRDSQALLDHLKNLGDTMAAILQTCSASGEICGTPGPELIEQLKGSPVQVYTPFLPKLDVRGICENS